jgi:hypothetical protein
MYQPQNKTYNIPESDVISYKDFNPDVEKKELKTIKRSFNKNPISDPNMPNTYKKRFNKITKSWEDISKDEIEDGIQAIEEIGEIKESVDSFLASLKKDVSKHLKSIESDKKNSILISIKKDLEHILNTIN